MEQAPETAALLERLRPVPIHWHIRQLEREIETAEWEGRDATFLRQRLDAAKTDEARGETFFVPF